ncbi:AbgT family transporter [Lacticigenium naphthae]|uniref:AbgT family transporter n=1 Tax=Lacticigenium naphthae TaxID=515351 RepID=UPI00041CFA47|nr:AbgT family transporter [Lacticigenium naphthae]
MDKSNEKSSGFLGTIERVGNKLPHPAVIFVLLSLSVIIISDLVARSGASVQYFDAGANEDITVTATSLLNAEGLRHIFNTATSNFTGFAPLGTVLVAMLGVGVAEWSGLIGSALKKMVHKVPTSLLTYVIVFAGIISNIASDAGYVVVVPLGAIVFAGAGRHPIAGLAAAFAGVSAGFSANLIFGPTDALLSGITNEALNSVNIPYTVDVTGNWYFIIASTFILTIVGAMITKKIVEPRLGEYTGSYKPTDEPLTDDEQRGLRNAGIALGIFLIILLFLTVPENGAFREFDEATGNMTLGNFLSNGLIFLIFLLFAIPGYFYGRTTGKMLNSHHFVESMTDSMRSMGGYIVLAFFAAQFINYFSYTNLGMLIAVGGADVLETIGLTGLPLIMAFILLTSFINLFMGSASAKWAIMGPVFVPMFYTLSLSPEMTQMAYRIADSSSNVVSPLMSYFAMILVFMKRYDKKSGIGTLISTMLPYTIAFLISWSILLIIWFTLGLPLGPGAPVRM